MRLAIAFEKTLRFTDGGIKKFLKGRKSYKTTYTITRDKDDSVTFDLWIICKYRKGKLKKRGVQYFVYVAYKVQTNLDYIYQDLCNLTPDVNTDELLQQLGDTTALLGEEEQELIREMVRQKAKGDMAGLPKLYL